MLERAKEQDATFLKISISFNQFINTFLSTQNVDIFNFLSFILTELIQNRKQRLITAFN